MPRATAPAARARGTIVAPGGCAAAGPATPRTRARRPGPARGTGAAVRRTSRDPNHQRAADEELEGQGGEAEQQQRPGGLLVLGVARYLNRGLLELVDLAEDAAQGLAVARAKVAAAGLVGDLAQQRLVDPHRQELVPEAPQAATRRDRRLTDGAYADGVDPNAVCRRRGRGGPRIDQALVVLAVGKEEDDLGLVGGPAQS